MTYPAFHSRQIFHFAIALLHIFLAHQRLDYCSEGTRVLNSDSFK